MQNFLKAHQIRAPVFLVLFSKQEVDHSAGNFVPSKNASESLLKKGSKGGKPVKVDVGYFPTSYYGPKPDASGFFPFALNGETNYVFAISEFDLRECGNELVPSWMTHAKAFPIYVCAKVLDFWEDEFEQHCSASNIQSDCIGRGKDYSFFVSEIENETQLKAIFPYYIMLSIANELVVWSSKKNVFSLEKPEWTGEVYKGVIRKTVVVTMEADTSIFWIGHDGDFIAVISNQSTFSTYEQTIQTFPDFVVPTPFTYT